MLAGALSTPALASDIGFSISIGQPGFYGQLDLGGYPRPALLYPQPLIIERNAYNRPPIYLRVPPGHAKHWDRHCHEYRACGERVYFVRDDWYEREYVPRYQDRHGYREDRREERRGGWNDQRGDERRGRGNDDGDDDRGRGRGHGHGHNH